MCKLARERAGLWRRGGRMVGRGSHPPQTPATHPPTADTHPRVRGAAATSRQDKWTALYLAAKSKTTGGFRRAAQDPRGHASCVESLLKAGADTSLKTDVSAEEGGVG
eukprot:scaffold130820_cov36-Phaeocystis_antarctica.AAC.1